MEEPDFNVIEEEVGVLGGTVLLVGNVIAMTVFLLPAHLLAEQGVGPSIAVAMVLVSLPVAFGMLGLLQVGGAMPAAGGNYVYASRLIHPYFGFLLPWVTVPVLWFGQVYLAYGFAEFTRFFVDLPLILLMYAVLIPFIALNVLGIRLVAQVQAALVAVILAGMLAFIVPGVLHVDPGNYTPLYPPDGIGPFVVTLISLSIALQGFNVITDLGEELRDPVRNIPRVLALGAAISITLMVAVVVVAVGVVPWRYYVNPDGTAVEAGVARAATEFLPGPIAALVALAAVVGAVTTINTLYTSYSRQIMRAARDQTIPNYFAEIHPEYQTPHRSILLIALPALLIVPFTPSPVAVSVAVAMAALFGATVSSIALWNLPKRFPKRYKYSLYRIPKPLLKTIAVLLFVVNAVFLLLVSTQVPVIAAALAAWIILGYPAYRYRVRKFRGMGVDLPSRMKDLHRHEEERARRGSKEQD